VLSAGRLVEQRREFLEIGFRAVSGGLKNLAGVKEGRVLGCGGRRA
jgi:hypothetical protein